METVTIFTAGRSHGNPGPAAVGVYVVDDTDQVVLEYSSMIGNATDDFAAYQAVVEAFELVQQHFGAATKDMQFKLMLDNEFVKKQINSEAPVTDPRSVSHFIHVHNLQVEHFSQLSLVYLPHEQNLDVIKLVEATLDEQ